MFEFLKKLFKSEPPVDFAQMVKDGAKIVDVRTADEFRSGHIKGSENISLQQLNSKIPQLKKSGKPVITVCRSGSRSSMAVRMLKSNGISAINGGAWNSLQNKI